MNDVLVTIQIHSACDERTDTNSVPFDWDYSCRVSWVDWVFDWACEKYGDVLRRQADG